MKISTPTRKMTFGIIVKERNKMTMRNSQTEFTRTSPEIQFCLMLFRSELKELVNTITCFGENKQTKILFHLPKVQNISLLHSPPFKW